MTANLDPSHLKELVARVERMQEIEREIFEHTPRSTHKPQHYLSPIHLPKKRLGDVRITHSAKKGPLPIIGFRQALMLGISSVNVNIVDPIRVHSLEQKRGSRWNVWMTDLPEELNQIHRMIHDVQPAGRVLIGGLGLGVCARLVAELKKVQDVTVVDNNLNVIKLISGGLPPMCEVVHDEILNYLLDTKETFDYYLLDTWAGTNETTWWNEVMPLRRVIRNRQDIWHPVIHCWAEDIMLGQVWKSLMFNSNVWHYKGLPAMDFEAAKWFTDNVGTKEWELRYGKIVDGRTA